jgi:hypothetical protein
MATARFIELSYRAFHISCARYSPSAVYKARDDHHGPMHEYVRFGTPLTFSFGSGSRCTHRARPASPRWWGSSTHLWVRSAIYNSKLYNNIILSTKNSVPERAGEGGAESTRTHVGRPKLMQLKLKS